MKTLALPFFLDPLPVSFPIVYWHGNYMLSHSPVVPTPASSFTNIFLRIRTVQSPPHGCTPTQTLPQARTFGLVSADPIPVHKLAAASPTAFLHAPPPRAPKAITPTVTPNKPPLPPPPPATPISKPPTTDLESLPSSPLEAVLKAAHVVEKTVNHKATHGEFTDTLGKYMGLMWPTSHALHHPAAPLLHNYAAKGCPVDCGPDWTMEQLLAALEYGAHPTADDPIAADCLEKETQDKIERGFARIVTWGDLLKDLPSKLKLSPVAMIPGASLT